MVDRSREVQGVRVPAFMYGTAWKEDATKGLVREALRAGFRAIDTANQRKHYHEAGVGAAIADAMDGGEVTRDELFLQTKFTFEEGQDHRLPYDPRAPVGEQVAQSFESSLEHLGVARLDSYLLHGPSQGRGLGEADREAWSAMEALHAAGRVRLLGVSNVTGEQLELLRGLARVKPAFVQNRCYAVRGWDAAVRAICDQEGIVYQGFSLLTANGHALAGDVVRGLAEKHARTPAQIVFRMALEVGMLPLTGTTSRAHMDEDVAVYDFALAGDEVAALLNAR